MTSRPYTPPLARAMVTVGSLLVVGLPAYVSVVHGNVIDLGAFVYAVPITAIAFAVLATIGYRLVSIAPGTPVAPGRLVTWRASRHPFLHLAVSVAGLVIVGIYFVLTDADTRAYNADASCTAPSYERTADGACVLVPAQIVDAWTTSSRSGTRKHLRLALSDGSQSSVTVFPSSAFWHAAGYGTDRSATVQFYRGRIVEVTTTEGRAQTSGMPAARLQSAFIIAIVLALFGMISAARILFSPS